MFNVATFSPGLVHSFLTLPSTLRILSQYCLVFFVHTLHINSGSNVLQIYLVIHSRDNELKRGVRINIAFA